MTPELAYFLKINVAIILFYAFYRLFFYKDTFFQWRRITLLAFFVTAFVYPLLNIQEWVKEQEPMAAIANLYANVVLPEITIPSEVRSNTSWFETVLQSLTYIYWGGVLLLGIRFFTQLVSIFLISRRSKKVVLQGTQVRLLDKPSGPFSFFKWIFLYPEELSEKETEEILTHELTHVRQWHSFDVIFSEAAGIFCWINPFVWLLKREVRHNLEYMADDKVLKRGHDSKSYQYHLLGLAHHKVATNIYNNFNVLPLKNRIVMMNRKRTNRIGRTKYIMFLPLALLLMLFSNIEAVARIATQISDGVFNTDNKIEVKGQVVNESGKPIQGVSVIVANTSNGTLTDKDGNFTIPVEDNQSLFFSFIGLKSVIIPIKDAKLPLKVVMKEEITEYKEESRKGSPKIKSDNPDEPIFMVVEEMPSYPGGMDALIKFINDNIREEAKTKGVAGRVIVQFTVDKDGSVTSPEVVRSVHPDLDKEALRIVGKMPKWNPGKQRGKAVAVKYTVPITFAAPSTSQEEYAQVLNAFPAPSLNEDNATTDGVFQVVEKMPQYPGGMKAMMEYLGKNIRYPAEAHKAGVQGRVIAQFIVNTDGSTSDYKVVRSVSPELDTEAIRVLSSMPTWTPGYQRGKAVRVKYTVPVTFRLSGPKIARPAPNRMMEGNVIYILDGKKITAKEASDLNQHNIENFVMYTSPDKLKEYGAEGADGVVVITTRILTE